MHKPTARDCAATAPQRARRLLAADVGGTKTLMLLAEASADSDADGRQPAHAPRPTSPRIIVERRYQNADWPDFSTLLADFLGADGEPVAAACFAVAGPVTGTTARLTYLPWQLDAAALAKRFAIGDVLLVNDFLAAARGIDALPATALRTLHAGKPQPGAARVVVGAGTGLGVAGLLERGEETRVVPSEGGHQGFAPYSLEHAALWQDLFAQNGRVTAEDVVSGPGLTRVMAFLGGGEWPPAQISAAARGEERPPAIDAAKARTALALWFSAFGAFAGDQALTWLARGGVYLAGGIAAKLMDETQQARFLAAFLDKREHRSLTAEMPVHLVTDERLGALGALALAAHR
ncbi:glucokinase [Rhodocyclus gracilis]|nr:glucokinase [Rhodocyclus gracilis]